MNWLQIRLFGPYFSSFSTNSYGYYSQKSQNLFSNGQIFASAQIVRQAANEQATTALYWERDFSLRRCFDLLHYLLRLSWLLLASLR